MKLLETPKRPDWSLVLAVEAGDGAVLAKFQSRVGVTSRAIGA
jgi:hypothetical protein